MPEPSFVTQVARTLYGLEPQTIESLDQYQFDWRGIYRDQDAQDGAWLIRLLQLPEVVDSLTHTARSLPREIVPSDSFSLHRATTREQLR
jgi:hypothetical protein